MSGKRGKTLRVLMFPQRHSRSVAEKVEVYLPPVQWTPALIEDVAKVLADALVRDLVDHPQRETRCAP